MAVLNNENYHEAQVRDNIRKMRLVLDTLPSWLKEYKATRRYRGGIYHITVKNPNAVQCGIRSVTINGKELSSPLLPLLQAGEEADVVVIMG